MTVDKPAPPPGSRIVSAGSITGSVVFAGDDNTTVTTLNRIDLPPPESVDLAAEIAALRDILARLDLPPARRIEGGFADLEAEAAKPPAERDPEAIVGILEPILSYFRKARDYTEQVEELQGHVAAIVSWAGPIGQRLLGYVGAAG